MKTFSLIFLFFSFTLILFAQDDKGTWDAYIASYEEGKPGSIILRMDLIEKAPLKEYSKLLVTGVTGANQIVA